MDGTENERLEIEKRIQYCDETISRSLKMVQEIIHDEIQTGDIVKPNATVDYLMGQVRSAVYNKQALIKLRSAVGHPITYSDAPHTVAPWKRPPETLEHIISDQENPPPLLRTVLGLSAGGVLVALFVAAALLATVLIL